MNVSLSSLPSEDNIILVDRVPEGLKDPVSKDLSATPETLSVLTDTDDSLGSSMVCSKTVATPPKYAGNIRLWCGQKFYSDMILDGLKSLNMDTDATIIYESPCSVSADAGTSFYNDVLFQFHDYPFSTPEGKTVMGPQRYAAMTGSAVPTYIQSPVPITLLEHWAKSIPGFVAPDLRHEITETTTVCAYLPLESLRERHMIDPFVHYELAGKGALPAMTPLTTKLLSDTKVVRPCVVKVSHSMGSRGIFLVRNDQEEEEVLKLLADTGKPSYVVTDFIDIERNLAAHFFIHPSGDITWFGSSENLLDKDGGWSADSTIRCPKEQDELRELMAPYVQEVVRYCVNRGYWGACGIDVLVDSKGKGFVVDVNPRVTGTCPALMVFQKLNEMDKNRFTVSTFRRSKQYSFAGSPQELFEAVDAHNSSQEDTRVVIFSVFEKKAGCTLMNIGVYGSSQVQCIKVLNQFATRN